MWHTYFITSIDIWAKIGLNSDECNKISVPHSCPNLENKFLVCVILARGDCNLVSTFVAKRLQLSEKVI